MAKSHQYSDQCVAPSDHCPAPASPLARTEIERVESTHSPATGEKAQSAIEALKRLLPGIGLCSFVAVAAYGVAAGEQSLFGEAWLEPLVLAILLGAALRTLTPIERTLEPGVTFSAKTLLEVAVALLGASVSAAMIAKAGLALLFGIFGIVTTAILASFLIGRLLGLPPRMALLIACGNSICGNSAIAAVAPVIGADGEDVAASIAFTAVLGVVVVLCLPLFGTALGLDGLRYGTLAGLTVYAVPQVIAASAPFGGAAIQMGTLVKLMRVLMLGPVCLALSLFGRRLIGATRAGSSSCVPARTRPPLHRLLPWFIVAFLSLVAARSLGAIPPAIVVLTASVATPLTVIAMAALGLSVDLRSVARAGTRVSLAVILSLLFLVALSLTFIHALPL